MHSVNIKQQVAWARTRNSANAEKQCISKCLAGCPSYG